MKTIFCLALLLSTAYALTGCVATATTVAYDEPVYYHRPYRSVYIYESRPAYYHRTVYKKGPHHYNKHGVGHGRGAHRHH